MMPVKPPAASANSNTAGNQNRRRRCERCSGGALTIAFGEYDLNFEPGDFEAIRFPALSKTNVASDPGETTTWVATVHNFAGGNVVSRFMSALGNLFLCAVNLATLH